MGIPLAEEADWALEAGPVGLKVHKVIVVPTLKSQRYLSQLHTLSIIRDKIEHFTIENMTYE